MLCYMHSTSLICFDLSNNAFLYVKKLDYMHEYGQDI